MVRPEIHLYQYFFIVKYPYGRFIQALYQLSGDYTTFEETYDPIRRKKRWKPSKTFGVYIGAGQQFRFHINQHDEFIKILRNKGVTEGEYKLHRHAPPKASTIKLKVRSHYKLRTEHGMDQEAAKDFLLEKLGEGTMPLLAMPTGTGKGVTSMTAAASIGKRILVFVLSKYVDKWVSDIHDILEIDKKDICRIQGGDQLVNATHWTKDKETLRNNPLPKAFVVSIDTYTIWLKKYERDPGAAELDAYGCMPWEFFKALDVGFVAFDEAHEHLHKLYRIFTFLDVENAVCCTATMLSKNPTISKVQFMMFPQNTRFDEIKMKQYINVVACSYQITNYQNSKVKTSYPADNRYNHNAFEESILNHKLLKPQYIDMVMCLIYDNFVKSIEPGQGKLIIFVASIDMGNALAKEIKKRWPCYDTRTYFQEDPYANIIEADIRVTTIISGSTAIDVKGLVRCIMTNNVDSPVSNLQALGRLREIPGTQVEFLYIYCSSIDKQREYHYNKVDLFRSRVKSHTDRFIGTLFSS